MTVRQKGREAKRQNDNMAERQKSKKAGRQKGKKAKRQNDNMTE